MTENGVIKFNQNRDVEKVIYQGAEKITKAVKYGQIRLAGEKEKRRISWETYHKISTMPANYNRPVEIPELRMSVMLNQIVFQEECQEEISQTTHLTDLPTDIVFLSWNLEFLPKEILRARLDKMGKPYVIATLHYDIVNGEKAYYIKPEQIKRAMYMKPQLDGYPHAVCKVTSYGRELDIKSGEWR